MAVAEDCVAARRGADEFHEDVGAPPAGVGAQRGQKGRDLGAVDVVAAALALRLEHVCGRAGGIGGERDGVLASRRAIERVDGGKRLADPFEVRGVRRKESLEVGGRRGRERLLDFLRAGQMGED